MKKKRSLATSRINKKDEFYTLYKDIENELQYYTKHFENKVVYCNCDDYRHSNFWKFFKDNFNQLGLQKLISTCYIEGGQGLKAEYDGVNVRISELKGDGDFRSNECCRIMEKSDIICTNPPFSLFKEYVKNMALCSKKNPCHRETRRNHLQRCFSINSRWSSVDWRKHRVFYIQSANGL